MNQKDWLKNKKNNFKNITTLIGISLHLIKNNCNENHFYLIRIPKHR